MLCVLVEMLAAWSLAMATLIYARHVYLDAQGRLPRRRGRARPRWLRWPRLGWIRLRRSKPRAHEVDEGADGESPVAIPIEGSSARRPRRRASESVADRSAKPSSDASPGTPKTASGAATVSGAKSASTPRSERTARDEDQSEDWDVPEQELSRAERRRQRKEKRRQRRAA